MEGGICRESGSELVRKSGDDMWMIISLAAAAAEPEPGDTYRLGAGDTVEIQVYQEEDLTGMYTIREDGFIEMPLLGRVCAVGRSVGELSDGLAEELGSAFLVNPQVSVRVETFNSQPVQVLGGVNKPGVIYLTGPTTLQEILAKAGGLSSVGSAQEVLIKNDWDGEQKNVDLGRLLSEGEGNYQLRGGDVVYVSEGQTVYVAGEVDKPGSVPFQEGLTITEAIAEAGGATPTATLREVYILRDGERLQINVKRILKGRIPDVELMRGDQIFIEESVL